MFYLPKSSLELTFDLIRHVQPSLALKVRNAALDPNLNKEQARIAMEINEEDIFTIVNQLMVVENQARVGAKADKGKQILASALIADWLTLNIND